MENNLGEDKRQAQAKGQWGQIGTGQEMKWLTLEHRLGLA